MSVSVVTSVDSQYTVLLDQVSATLAYIGEAPPNSATSASVWRIRKLDTTTGVDLRYADGDTFFNNVWNDRASLPYL